MLELLKQIRMVIGNSIFSMNMYNDSIVFYIYEGEVPMTFQEGIVFIDCETYDGKITDDMTNELIEIMEHIKNAKVELIELLEVGDKYE